jgi:hypothetical protein
MKDNGETRGPLEHQWKLKVVGENHAMQQADRSNSVTIHSPIVTDQTLSFSSGKKLP